MMPSVIQVLQDCVCMSAGEGGKQEEEFLGM